MIDAIEFLSDAVAALAKAIGDDAGRDELLSKARQSVNVAASRMDERP